MARSLPLRLIFAYVLDWVLILCIAAFAGGLSYVTPYKRPFSLLDLNISFPYVQNDLISTRTLILVSLVAPGLIILLVTAIFLPAPAARRQLSSSSFWRTKLWEFNVGWMGLGLSFVLALLFTQGMKNMFGKPRPDLLSRCQPDLTNIAAHVVGGYGQDISSRWTLVSQTICTNNDKSIMNDGFRSFPSGHSSSSWSGLLYLSFWLASKLNLTIPHSQSLPSQNKINTRPASSNDEIPLPRYGRGGERQSHEASLLHETSSVTNNSEDYRKGGAAPPIFGFIFVITPIAVAIYICSTRFVDFKHQGIDIFSGSLIGIISAWIGFRFYHGSLLRGQSWAWAPRTTSNAFAMSAAYWAQNDAVRTQERTQRQRQDERASDVEANK